MNFIKNNLDMTFLTKEKCAKKLAGLGASLGIAALSSLSTLSSIQAAPFIDTFETTNQLVVVMNSSTLSNNGGTGPLTVLSNESSPGVYGAYGKAIINWYNVGGSPLSLDTADEQYVFAFTGGTPIGGTSVVNVAFYISVPSNPSFVLETGIISPVDGAWSYNVYEAATAGFGAPLPSGASYSVQLYFAPATEPIGADMGYSFESFQATAVPEPKVAILFAVACGFLLLRKVNQRSFRLA